MQRILNRYQGGSLRGLYKAQQTFSQQQKSATVKESLFWPTTLWHVYLKLDFEKCYENAENKTDATSFLRNVGKAVQVAERMFSNADGVVVEAQGSMIHLLLPSVNSEAILIGMCKSLHALLNVVFKDSSKVMGWRMSADCGVTMLVESRGIHDDRSFVSLGKSANRPAKFLYREILSKNEDERTLKRFHLGVYQPDSGRWKCYDLQQIDASVILANRAINFSAVDLEVKVKGIRSNISGVADINAQAAPLKEQGSPTNSDPNVYYGWVMRADLDGFTKRVADCGDDEDALMELAQNFSDLMDSTADFAKKHNEVLIQLPWSGDNFTAISVYDSIKKYKSKAEDKFINLSLDFDAEMHGKATQSGFRGWAQGIAGGDVHGNASGNIFLGSVSVPGHRFLIAAGVGVGRSLQAFLDMNPEPQQFAVWKEDRDNLFKPYKDCLTDRSRADAKESDLFRKGVVADLQKAREEMKTELASTYVPSKTALSVGGSKVIVSSRVAPLKDDTEGV